MGIRDFIAGKLIRPVNVYRVDDFSVEPPETHRVMDRPQTHSMRPELSVGISRPFDFFALMEKMKRPAVNVALTGRKATAKNYRIKRYVKEDVRTHTYQLVRKPKTHTLLKQIQAMPQERENILKYMKKRPETLKGEMILACYGPIVEGAVLKLVLNKQRGTLLVWYKSGSRRLKAGYVYLIRRLGLGAKPEWCWL